MLHDDRPIGVQLMEPILPSCGGIVGIEPPGYHPPDHLGDAMKLTTRDVASLLITARAILALGVILLVLGQ